MGPLAVCSLRLSERRSGCIVLLFFFNKLIRISISVQGFCAWRVFRITNTKKTIQTGPFTVCKRTFNLIIGISKTTYPNTRDVTSLLFSLQFFPYVLLLVAVSVYMPALFWRFTGAPVLSSDLTFIMEELDRSYNRAIKLAKRPHTTGVQDSESARIESKR